jgi:hypothetical protein
MSHNPPCTWREGKSNLRAETHLQQRRAKEMDRHYTGNDEKGGISATDRDRILERTLGIYKIPLDDRIRRLELTELGIVRFAKQILRDLRQGLWQEGPNEGGVIGARYGVEYNNRRGKKSFLQSALERQGAKRFLDLHASISRPLPLNSVV